MPLVHGFGAASFEKNVRKMRKEGRSTAQSIAAAYATARRALEGARRKETRALRDAWKLAIAKGLHGTGKMRDYVASFTAKRTGRTGRLVVYANNLKGARAAAKTQLRRRYKSGFTIRNVRLGVQFK